MRFVETKTMEQQSCLVLHRTRHLFIRQQTSLINAIRAHLAEFGIVAPVGRKGLDQLLGVVSNSEDKRIPEVVRACVVALGAQLRALKAQILEFDRQIVLWHRSHETSKRLDEVPGSVRLSPPPWSPVSLIRKHSARGVTSQPGSAWCLSSIRAGAKTSSAVSASKVIATCAACSRRARLL
jgi:hypothetical protein